MAIEYIVCVSPSPVGWALPELNNMSPLTGLFRKCSSAKPRHHTGPCGDAAHPEKFNI